MLITYVDSKELGSCPAAVLMDDGTIQINADVWHRYTPYQQQFILAHEQGHYELQTQSEELADLYALRTLHGTSPQSLKQSIDTLVKMGNVIPTERVMALYIQALKIDATINQNQRAKTELAKICTGTSNKTQINNNNNKTMRQSKYNKYHRADGATTGVDTTEHQPMYADSQLAQDNQKQPDYNRLHIITNLKPGLQIGGTFFDLHTILMAAILVVLCMIYKKK
ncbi:MAG: hypothetical protein J6V54_10765 [Bacteroidales bacterium]|nr:hypothetical protein [Bacteroidales bacterium]